MPSTIDAQELYRQLTDKTLTTLGLWAEANERVLRELVEFNAGTAKEGVRLYAELSRTAIDTVGEAQASLLRWQERWTRTLGDPMAWYQKTLAEGVNDAQQALRRFEESVQVVTRGVERVQASAEHVSKSVQDTVTATATKVKEQYATR